LLIGRRRYTWKALVLDLEVRSDVVGARLGGVELLVRQVEDAGAPSRAPGVEYGQDVGAAAEVAEVSLHTSALLHAAVARSTNDDDATTSSTASRGSVVAADVHLLHRTELALYQRRTCNV